MNTLNALAVGDFRALLDSIMSTDRIEGEVSCPCGRPNTVISVREGVSVLTWANVNETHGVAGDIALQVVAYGSVAEAMETMDELRREMELHNGMAQLANALGGDSATVMRVIV